MKRVLNKIQVKVNVKIKKQFRRRIGDTDKSKTQKQTSNIIIEFSNWNLKVQIRKGKNKPKETKIYMNKKYTKKLKDHKLKIFIFILKEKKQTERFQKKTGVQLAEDKLTCIQS